MIMLRSTHRRILAQVHKDYAGETDRLTRRIEHLERQLKLSDFEISRLRRESRAERVAKSSPPPSGPLPDAPYIGLRRRSDANGVTSSRETTAGRPRSSEPSDYSTTSPIVAPIVITDSTSSPPPAPTTTVTIPATRTGGIIQEDRETRTGGVIQSVGEFRTGGQFGGEDTYCGSSSGGSLSSFSSSSSSDSSSSSFSSSSSSDSGGGGGGSSD